MEKTIEERHLFEKNKMTFICLLFIHIVALVTAVMFNLNHPIKGGIVLVIVVIGLAITILGRLKFVYTDKGHLVMFIGVLITFFDMMWTNVESPYVFAFTFLICFVIMLHKSVTTCIIGMVVALLGNGVFTVEYIIAGFPQGTTVLICDDIMALLGCIIAYSTVKVMDSQDREFVESIKQNAIAQEESANLVRETSAEIKTLLTSANESVDLLSSNISSSASSMNQISESTKQTAVSIQTQTSMSSNITESLDLIVERTHDMAATSSDASKVVSEGNITVEELKRQSEIVSKINEETAAMTADLQNRAQGIKEVVDTILQISSQTNLLSLNASIEAARAGEAGRGFAVVADEIRNLSDSTKESAEEISQVIDLLVQNIENASNNMTKSVEATSKEAELIEVTGDKFESINDAVSQLSVAVNEIEERVTESATANNEVMDSISNLSASSEQVVASAETSLTVSQECVTGMDETKSILDRIFALSEQL